MPRFTYEQLLKEWQDEVAEQETLKAMSEPALRRTLILRAQRADAALHLVAKGEPKLAEFQRLVRSTDPTRRTLRAIGYATAGLGFAAVSVLAANCGMLAGTAIVTVAGVVGDREDRRDHSNAAMKAKQQQEVLARAQREIASARTIQQRESDIVALEAEISRRFMAGERSTWEHLMKAQDAARARLEIDSDVALSSDVRSGAPASPLAALDGFRASEPRMNARPAAGDDKGITI